MNPSHRRAASRGGVLPISAAVMLALLGGCNTLTNLTTENTPEDLAAIAEGERPVSGFLSALVKAGGCGDVLAIWDASLPSDRTEAAQDGAVAACEAIAGAVALTLPIEATVYDAPLDRACAGSRTEHYGESADAWRDFRATVCEREAG